MGTKKKRVASKKKAAQVTVGFEAHFPGFVKKKETRMKSADIILVELAPEIVETVLTSKKASEQLIKEKLSSDMKEYGAKNFRLLRKMHKQGKQVIGTEVLPKDSKKIQELKNLEFTLAMIGGITLKEDARYSELREEARINELKRIIKENPGKKIYIQAGAVHTPVWHALRKELGKNVKVKFLGEEKLEKRVKMRYPPLDQLKRMYSFGIMEKLAPEKRKEVEERLKREDLEFELIRKRLGREYERKGLSPEQAEERAMYETLKLKHWGAPPHKKATSRKKKIIKKKVKKKK